MTKIIKIDLPTFIDDPMVGRCFVPFGVFTHNLEIESGKLRYKASDMSGIPEKTISIENIKKIIIQKKRVHPWTKDGKFDPYGRNGTEIRMVIIEADNQQLEIMPCFLMNSGKKKWQKALRVLVEITGLQVDEIVESEDT